jgi:hypothetical protein
MSLFLAWAVYPAVLLALCVGLGLLVDVLVGRRLPGALVAPVGLASLVVVGQFTTLAAGTASLTVPLVCFLAVLGAGFSLPWRFGRPDPWPVAVALAVFVVFGAPVLFSGEPTFAGYIKLDDTATWLALTDRVMEHGRDLGGLAPSSYLATLEANLPGGYPIGVFLPFGSAQKLVGGDLAWVFQPYLSFLAAMLSLCLWQILGSLLERSRERALGAFVAAQPALLYGYAMWGGVKELGSAVFVALAAALAPIAVRQGADRRDAAALGLVGGALVGVLSIGGLVWLGPMLIALALVGVRALGIRAAGRQALAFVLVLALCVTPVLSAGGFNPFQAGLTSESELGNLAGPLDPLQVLGIWPSGDFRLDPAAGVAAAVLIALGIFAAGAGIWAAWRNRALALLLFAGALLACIAIVVVGSPWVDAKALATAAPAALGLAIAGAIFTLRADWLTGAALVLLVSAGVVWSNALAYGGASLAPYEQLRELQRIGADYTGQGPALMTEYNPYGARHFLRGVDGEGTAELRVRPVPLATGGSAEKGESVDTDRIATAALLEYPTLVLRRSPVRSRPPSPYRLVRSGHYYEVWQRPFGYPSSPASQRLPLGGPFAPAEVPSCSEVARLARVAAAQGAAGAHLLAARHVPVYDASDGVLEIPTGARYVAWLGGSVRGSVVLFVDGEEIGEARHQLQNNGGFIELGQARLGAGAHDVELRFGGADLHPGSGGFPRPETGPLLFSAAAGEAGPLVSVPPAESKRLCGRPWDWIEAVS